MGSLVNSRSWLIFDLLGLSEYRDWLQTPAAIWYLFSEFRSLTEFAVNLPVCNDIDERGIYLMSDFISPCDSE